MSTWMMSGPGQALFLGNPNVSQFNPSGQVSPGAGYIPDEVAKMLVKESGLRKSDTCSKRMIIGYLESMGLSSGLAPDVAMVLRNVYGITPTFDESTLYARSGSLIEELMGVVSESYPAPFRFDEPEILNEEDVISSYIASEYMESEDEEYDIVLEHLSVMSPHDFLDVVEFYEWVGADGFAYLGDLIENGPDGLAEQVIEGLCFPDRILSEDIQYHIEKIDIDDAIRKGQKAKRSKATAGFDASLRKGQERIQAKKVKTAKKRTAAKGVSWKKQMKGHAKDRDIGAGDPLAQRQTAAKKSGVGAMKMMSPAEREARREAGPHRAAERQMAAKMQKRSDSRAAMKAKGAKAVGLMKKVGGAAAKLGLKAAGGLAKGAAHTIGRVASGAARAAGATAGAAGSTAKSAAGAGVRAASRVADNVASKSGGKSGDGIISKIGRAIGGFGRAIKQGYMAGRPGVARTSEKAKENNREKGPAGSTSVGEDHSHSGKLLSEMRHVLDGAVDDRAADEPSDALSRLEVRDLVGQAVIEALSQLDWDEVCQLASMAMIPVEESQALVSAYQNGSGDFFHAWRGAKSRIDIPSALKKESFDLLASLSMDEGVVPVLIGYSVQALRSAGDDVAVCVEDAYPDLGKTIYGPSGDPSEGPKLAKSYMTPHTSCADVPSKDMEVMTTRMFSDPNARDMERASKLSDVKNVLGAMRAAAATAGVNPEGMFLNTYRDMHREKVRYS